MSNQSNLQSQTGSNNGSNIPSSTTPTPSSSAAGATSQSMSEQQSISSVNTITAIGGVKINENDELRANFTDRSKQITNDQLDTLPIKQPTSSPLLSSTPPTVSKSLIRSYPYLILINKILGALTWTDNSYISLLLVTTSSIFILYFENIIIYMGHLLIVSLILLYTLLHSHLEKEQELHPTLDDVIFCLTTVSMRSDILLSPIVSLGLTSQDLKRLLFTTIFLSPGYILISYFILSPRSIILIITLILLTYHSSWSRVTRKLLWRSKTFRLICFYITGLDFELQHSNKSSLFKIAMTKTNKKLKEVTIKANGLNTGPVRFTYVLYENQRRWLGVGWTPNLLSYERTPWTDEFLNESESPENFELPQLNDDTGMYWRWVDKTWRLDLTNDGALQLPSSKSKTVADPKSDDGYIYYDNTWKNPTTEDSFSKYTRRRRWIRTAELVSPNDDDDDDNHTDETDDVNTTDVSNVPLQQSSSSINSFPGPKVSHSSLTDIQNVTAIGTSTSASASASTSTSGSEILQNSSNSKPSKRKSLRFDKTPTILEHEDEKKSVPESVIDDGTVDEIDDVGPVDVKLD